MHSKALRGASSDVTTENGEATLTDVSRWVSEMERGSDASFATKTPRGGGRRAASAGGAGGGGGKGGGDGNGGGDGGGGGGGGGGGAVVGAVVGGSIPSAEARAVATTPKASAACTGRPAA